MATTAKVDMIKTIAVLGAGHGGHAAAADLVRRGFDVRLHARSEKSLVAIRDQGGIVMRGIYDGLVPFTRTTTDIAEAVNGADLIMLVVPSVAHETYARLLAPLLRPEQILFLNPGHTGGGLHMVQALREAGYTAPVQTCETVTLTYICRMEEPAAVNVFSYTKNLAFAAFPGRHAARLFELMKPLFPEIALASSVLETALSNINAIFHPPGMLMNAGWIEATDGDFLFYKEGITESVGRVTAGVDAERMAIAQALGVPTTRFLDTFLRAGLTTIAAVKSGSISRACRESVPNQTIKSPPSLDHRYVHEDVGCGLVPFSELGRLVGIATPTIDALIVLASLSLNIDFRKTGLSLEKMGLADKTPAQLLNFLESGA
jgi:opine dehydrogenase